MKRVLLVLIICLLMISKGVCKDKSYYIKLADDKYNNYALTTEQRKEVMEKLFEAADDMFDDYDILWRAARAGHWYGDTLYLEYQIENAEKAADKIKKVKHFQKRSLKLTKIQSKTLLEIGKQARKCSKQAIKINPRGPEGNYYNACAIGIYAFGKSIVKALLEGLGPKYEKSLDRAIEVDEKYLDGKLFAAYGRYYYKLPWPKKSLKKSLKNLEKAYSMNPKDIGNLDYLGDTCFAMKKIDKAKEYWQEALNTPYKSYGSKYTRKIVEEKMKLLQK